MRDLNLNQPYLTQHKINKRLPDRLCNGLKSEEFGNIIGETYNGIITWRKNQFKLLSRKAPKLFIKELTTWSEHCNNKSGFQGIALKMFIVLPTLILQKPFKNSKAKSHCLKVEERMKLLHGRCILENVIKNCKLFQRRLVTSKRQTTNSISKTFAKLILSGKVNASLKLLMRESVNRGMRSTRKL